MSTIDKLSTLARPGDQSHPMYPPVDKTPIQKGPGQVWFLKAYVEGTGEYNTKKGPLQIINMAFDYVPGEVIVRTPTDGFTLEDIKKNREGVITDLDLDGLNMAFISDRPNTDGVILGLDGFIETTIKYWDSRITGGLNKTGQKKIRDYINSLPQKVKDVINQGTLYTDTYLQLRTNTLDAKLLSLTSKN